jgi:uncharacterized membrane protein YoaK (UPF0700 family)
VTTFLGVCLLVFAAWLAIGIVSRIGKTRPSVPSLLVFLFAAFAVYVLTASALALPRS